MDALTFPCANLRRHPVLPVPAESTASLELASVAEEVTTAKLEALVHCAGRCEGAPLRPTREASLRPRLRTCPQPPHSGEGALLRMVVVVGACAAGYFESFWTGRKFVSDDINLLYG
jgi:hypothetical protein